MALIDDIKPCFKGCIARRTLIESEVRTGIDRDLFGGIELAARSVRDLAGEAEAVRAGQIQRAAVREIAASHRIGKRERAGVRAGREFEFVERHRACVFERIGSDLRLINRTAGCNRVLPVGRHRAFASHLAGRDRRIGKVNRAGVLDAFGVVRHRNRKIAGTLRGLAFVDDEAARRAADAEVRELRSRVGRLLERTARNRDIALRIELAGVRELAAVGKRHRTGAGQDVERAGIVNRARNRRSRRRVQRERPVVVEETARHGETVSRRRAVVVEVAVCRDRQAAEFGRLLIDVFAVNRAAVGFPRAGIRHLAVLTKLERRRSELSVSCVRDRLPVQRQRVEFCGSVVRDRGCNRRRADVERAVVGDRAAGRRRSSGRHRVDSDRAPVEDFRAVTRFVGRNAKGGRRVCTECFAAVFLAVAADVEV